VDFRGQAGKMIGFIPDRGTPNSLSRAGRNVLLGALAGLAGGVVRAQEPPAPPQPPQAVLSRRKLRRMRRRPALSRRRCAAADYTGR